MSEDRARYRTSRGRRHDPLASVTEKAFQQQIIDLARTLGWKTFHPYDSRRSDPGFPDLVLVKPPRVVFAELKRESGQLSPAQLVWFGLLSQCRGVEVYVWRPSNVDGVIATLQGEVGA